MIARKVAIYYAWSHPGETGAPLGVIEDRFPALFESRRMRYPAYEELADPLRFDQGIAGFLDHIMKRNFTAFLDWTRTLTGLSVAQAERVAGGGRATPLDAGFLDGADTLIVISFDSLRTRQDAGHAEIEALQAFLDHPDHLAFVCPHHDIGDVADVPHGERMQSQLVEFLHHGDRTIPPRQQFGGLARSLLAGLGVPVANRYGLRPAAEPDGSPSPIEVEAGLDRLHLLQGVATFNRHAHLPQLDRLGASAGRLDVLARQKIDPTAPPHPFTRGRTHFDALLQSRQDAFAGTLLVGDTTLWSSTAGGVDSLRRFWTNVVQRPHRP